MVVAVALALVLLGVLIGARGMRRLAASVTGPWKPGVTLLGLLAAFGALATVARGAWVEAAALAFLAAGCLGVARRRGPRPAIQQPPTMDRSEAAALLGVPPDATPAQADAAFRRLILKLHPDQGGTPGLSAKLLEARRVLAGR